jgi:hypothetical protein
MDNQEKLRAKLEQSIHEWISELHKIRAWCTEDTSLATSGLKEAQLEPTPIRSKELCYSCKEPWEPDHRCRGKGRVHYIEVHYDSDEC